MPYLVESGLAQTLLQKIHIHFTYAGGWRFPGHRPFGLKVSGSPVGNIFSIGKANARNDFHFVWFQQLPSAGVLLCLVQGKNLEAVTQGLRIDDPHGYEVGTVCPVKGFIIVENYRHFGIAAIQLVGSFTA